MVVNRISLFCSQEDEEKEEVSNGYVWGTSIQVSISQWYFRDI